MRAPPAAALVVAALAAASPALADDTVRACIDASTQGQTLRQQGHLLDARDRMIACSRDACPAVVRSHCVRWLGELDNRIPSVVVRAQDGAGTDLFDARVLIDGRPGKLDGRAVSLDPGEHVVTVESGAGRMQERVILVEGEASRLVMLRPGRARPGSPPPPPPRRPGPTSRQARGSSAAPASARSASRRTSGSRRRVSSTTFGAAARHTAPTRRPAPDAPTLPSSTCSSASGEPPSGPRSCGRWRSPPARASRSSPSRAARSRRWCSGY